VSWTTIDIPDLSGKTAVVTGANDGLGLESAKALAGAGAHVIMAARDQAKAVAAKDEILDAHSDASLEIVELDLASIDSIRNAAAVISKSQPKIDILINNAGLMALPERRTKDGFEMQFGVNHLGHWVLTADLLSAILAAEAARVVTVTSTVHHMGRRVDPSNVNMVGNYSPWAAYGQSKLANYHFAIGLQREFDRRRLNASSLAAHPGLSHTNLQVHTAAEGGAGKSGPFFERLAARFGMTAADGALPQLRAATDPNAKGGEMYAPRWINAGVPVRRPIMRRIGMKGAIDNLWMVSERETGVKFDFQMDSLGGS
jgi:NAD(P)-dependent dehydrogenase (short-subunit alcohol dehydrogenase family)